jgi:hypothetical protein
MVRVAAPEYRTGRQVVTISVSTVRPLVRCGNSEPGARRRCRTSTKGLRYRAIIAVLLGGALRQSEGAALTDGRCPGAFTVAATVAAPRTLSPCWF